MALDSRDWMLVKEAFGQLQNAPAGAQADLLATLAPDIRVEVVSLLDALAAPSAVLDLDARQEFPPGSQVGPYRLIGELGRGGMGVVYRVERIDGEVPRPLALKMAGQRITSGPDAERRFVHERMVLAALDHPHIVRFVDGGVWRGRRFLVMELVTGPPITEYCSARALPLRQRIVLMRQVCAAVAYAHQHLVLHRDLKPSNVLVTDAGHAKVLDFGIAQLVNEATLVADTATALNPMSFSCASPEQVRGEPVSLASDVYSLGTLLYHVLTGHNPQAPAGPSTSVADAVRLVLEHEPPPPSTVARGVPRDLDAITLKALSKQPAQRYSTVGALGEDLGRWLDGHPVVAVRRAPFYVATRFVQRRKALTAAVLALVVSVVVGGALVLRQTRIAEQRFEQARALANDLMFGLDEAVRTRSPLEARREIVAQGLQYLEGMAGSVRGDAGLTLELASGFRRIAEIQGRPRFANLGDREGAVKSAARSLDLLATLAGRDVREAGAVYDGLVASYTLMADLHSGQDALVHAKAALTTAERWRQHVPSEAADRAVGAAHFRLGSLSWPGPEHWEAARSVYETLLERQPYDPDRMRNVALVHKTLVDVVQQSQRPDRDTLARLHAARAAELDGRRLVLQPTSRVATLDAAISYAQLASTYEEAGMRRLMYERSLALRQQVARLDPTDQWAREALRRAWGQMAAARFEAGDLLGAGAAVETTLRMFSEDQDGAIPRADYVWRAAAHFVSAELEFAAGRTKNACRHLAAGLADEATSTLTSKWRAALEAKKRQTACQRR